MIINNKLPDFNNYDDFLNVKKKIKEYQKNNPNADVISLGIGDVSVPIIKPIIEAMHKAVDDLADIKTFKGYGSYYGYDFLKKAILENEYSNLNFELNEIYISNGTKTDSTSILELFDIKSKICTFEPLYPIYKNGATCLNRKIDIIKTNEANNFIPKIPEKKYDIIYLCSPNNPIGIAYSKDFLSNLVAYALKNNSIILYDNVYTAFIKDNNVPRTIYEIKDADKVAIEFRSFSKNASFTGVRCSYYIIPNKIAKAINRIWQMRTMNRFNGADYIAQRGAEATYLPESKKLIQENINYYLENANILKTELIKMHFSVWGGDNSPFVWIKTKNNKSSWEFFEELLIKLNIITIPGTIFGKSGDKYLRLSALANRKDILLALNRMKTYYEKKI